MPLYDFHCPACSATIELLVRASDEPGCPACGNKHLERLVSRTSPPGKAKGLVKAARAQAAREGHFSNY